MGQSGFLQKVNDILEAGFPGIEIELEMLSNGRISGYVSWTGFAGFDQVDRQNKLRDLLNQELGVDSQRIGVLLTYTPDEMEAMNAA